MREPGGYRMVGSGLLSLALVSLILVGWDSVAGAPPIPPPVFGITSVTPNPIPAAGGVVTLEVTWTNDFGAGPCTITSSPPLAGLPAQIPCLGYGEAPFNVTVPPNPGTKNIRFQFFNNGSKMDVRDGMWFRHSVAQLHFHTRS